MKLIKFFQQNPLRVELTLIVLVKLVALYGIWYFFINGHKVPRDVPHTTAHILSAPQPVSTLGNPTPTESQ